MSAKTQTENKSRRPRRSAEEAAAARAARLNDQIEKAAAREAKFRRLAEQAHQRLMINKMKLDPDAANKPLTGRDRVEVAREVRDVVAPIAQAHGIKLRSAVPHVTGDGQFSIELKGVIGGVRVRKNEAKVERTPKGLSREAMRYTEKAREYGLPKGLLGRQVQFNDNVYEVAGMKNSSVLLAKDGEFTAVKARDFRGNYARAQ